MSSLLPFVPRLTLTLIGDGLPSECGRVRDFQVAAMLADLSGFTALVESLTARLGGQAAERLQDVLNRCFVPITEIVDRTGGQVLAFPGDAALGIWLSDVADPNGLFESLSRTVDCGLELCDRLDGLVVGNEAVVRLRVAISAGSVRAALVGGVDGQWTVVVHGRAIEELADTLALAKPGEVIVSPAARELCGTRVTSTSRGSHGVVTGVAPAAPCQPTVLPDMVVPPDLLPQLVPASVRVRFEAGQHAWMSSSHCGERYGDSASSLSASSSTERTGLLRSSHSIRARAGELARSRIASVPMSLRANPRPVSLRWGLFNRASTPAVLTAVASSDSNRRFARCGLSASARTPASVTRSSMAAPSW